MKLIIDGVEHPYTVFYTDIKRYFLYKHEQIDLTIQSDNVFLWSLILRIQANPERHIYLEDDDGHVLLNGVYRCSSPSCTEYNTETDANKLKEIVLRVHINSTSVL